MDIKPTPKEEETHYKHMNALQELRSKGFAIILWYPSELQDVDPRLVEGRSVELGWEVIDNLKD